MTKIKVMPYFKAAVEELANNCNPEEILRRLQNQGLNENEARIVLEEAKGFFRAPTRKRGMVKYGLGLSVLMAMVVLKVFTSLPVLSLGILGGFLAALGLYDMFFGKTGPHRTFRCY